MRQTCLTIATLVGTCLAGSPEAAAQGDTRASPAQMRQWSADIAHRYLQGWSSGNAQALADVQGLYGPQVNFYGRFIDQQDLFGQKRRFGQRWPIRRYEHRPGTMSFRCDARTEACLVRSVIDWEAAHPGRGARSRGASTFELGIGFSGPRPVLLFERGRVISNGRRTAEAQ